RSKAALSSIAASEAAARRARAASGPGFAGQPIPMRNEMKPRLHPIALAQATLAALLASAGLTGPAQATGDRESWGYLHAQCWQEQVVEPRNICEVGLNDEPVLAIIVSNIVRL